jgi:hypothetical protein
MAPELSVAYRSRRFFGVPGSTSDERFSKEER